jgi:hypothetical protein
MHNFLKIEKNYWFWLYYMAIIRFVLHMVDFLPENI